MLIFNGFKHLLFNRVLDADAVVVLNGFAVVVNTVAVFSTICKSQNLKALLSNNNNSSK